MYFHSFRVLKKVYGYRSTKQNDDDASADIETTVIRSFP